MYSRLGKLVPAIKPLSVSSSCLGALAPDLSILVQEMKSGMIRVERPSSLGWRFQLRLVVDSLQLSVALSLENGKQVILVCKNEGSRLIL